MDNYDKIFYIKGTDTIVNTEPVDKKQKIKELCMDNWWNEDSKIYKINELCNINYDESFYIKGMDTIVNIEPVNKNSKYKAIHLCCCYNTDSFLYMNVEYPIDIGEYFVEEIEIGCKMPSYVPSRQRYTLFPLNYNGIRIKIDGENFYASIVNCGGMFFGYVDMENKKERILNTYSYNLPVLYKFKKEEDSDYTFFLDKDLGFASHESFFGTKRRVLEINNAGNVFLSFDTVFRKKELFEIS